MRTDVKIPYSIMVKQEKRKIRELPEIIKDNNYSIKIHKRDLFYLVIGKKQVARGKLVRAGGEIFFKVTEILKEECNE